MIYAGDALTILRTLPDSSVHCCISSPPYYGLRDYSKGADQRTVVCEPSVWGGDPAHRHGWETQIRHRSGGGPQVAQTKWKKNETVATAQRDTASSFCECGAWRGYLGLEPDHELYVHHIALVFTEVRRVLRDDATLWLNLGDSYANDGKWGGRTGGKHAGGLHGEPIGRAKRNTGLKAKDLCGIPWRVAFALQRAGYWLRSDIVWAKPAPMPESVTDRPTRSHEYIFLLTKSERYFYDHEAIKEPAVCGHSAGNGYKRDARLSYRDRNGARGSDDEWKPRPSAPKGTFKGKTEAMADTGQNAFRAVTAMRNLRDVWTVGAEPFPEAHFATFPPKLIEPCVIGGCPEGGTILDPFFGAGTTGYVARKHRRKFIGIELNPEYVAMAEKRLAQGVLEEG